LQFMSQNQILSAGGNIALKVTNLQGAGVLSPPSGMATMNGLPLGTSDGTPTGELVVKVLDVGGGGGVLVTRSDAFSLPVYDYFEITYFGATNNIATIVYKTGGSGGSTVATLTFTYVGGGVANDDLIATVTQT
jgi:hypothetical protein